MRAAAARRTPAAIALTFDNRGGGRQLTEHLIGLGHRRLGYIAGPQERTTTRHRLEGHRAALAAAGHRRTTRGWTVHGRVRPALRVRGDAGTAAPGPGVDGRRRRQRHRGAGRVRGAAGLRAADSGGRLGGGLRRPAVQHRRGARADDGAVAAVRGGGPGRADRHGAGGAAAGWDRHGAGGVDGAGVQSGGLGRPEGDEAGRPTAYEAWGPAAYEAWGPAAYEAWGS